MENHLAYKPNDYLSIKDKKKNITLQIEHEL